MMQGSGRQTQAPIAADGTRSDVALKRGTAARNRGLRDAESDGALPPKRAAMLRAGMMTASASAHNHTPYWDAREVGRKLRHVTATRAVWDHDGTAYYWEPRSNQHATVVMSSSAQLAGGCGGTPLTPR